jgi:hypothetical protein
MEFLLIDKGSVPDRSMKVGDRCDLHMGRDEELAVRFQCAGENSIRPGGLRGSKLGTGKLVELVD